MCVMVDACVVGIAFTQPYTGLFAPVMLYIESGKLKLVVGGHLLTEYYRCESSRRLIQSWQRAGKAFIVDTKTVSAAEVEVAASGLCVSNDTHIIALGQVSSGRILCTDDAKVATDFKNHLLINNPRGKVIASIPRRSNQNFPPPDIGKLVKQLKCSNCSA